MPQFSTPIDPNNALAIAAKLREAEKAATRRRITTETILRGADYAEERLLRLGLAEHPAVAVIHPEPAPRGVGHASATAAVLQRLPYGWLLIAAGRVPTRNLTKWTSLRSRVEVLVGVEQLTATMVEIGRAAGIRFVETGNADQLLRAASDSARVPLPGEPPLFVSTRDGRLLPA